MRIGVIGFTANGARVAGRLKSGLAGYGHEARAFAAPDCLGELTEDERRGYGIEPLKIPLRDWTGCFFGDGAGPDGSIFFGDGAGPDGSIFFGDGGDPARSGLNGSGLIFVGAAGIAVRSVAPFLRGKSEDPAVVVADETGRYVISLLSGHLGGANELARQAAAVLGAEPVITTATDLNRVFAVDLFAKKNALAVTDLNAAKRISAELLRGGSVGLFSDFPIEGEAPAGLTPGRRQRENIRITVKAESQQALESQKDGILALIPRAAVIGIGCRRGAAREDVARAADEAMRAGGLHPLSLRAAASIDIKKEEAGLLRFAEERRIPLFFYTAEELREVEGDFAGSDFVLRVTGVENVCERAAVRCCREHFAYLAAGKTAVAGVTAAVAVERRTLYF